jgi:hypothetical protein
VGRMWAKLDKESLAHNFDVGKLSTERARSFSQAWACLYSPACGSADLEPILFGTPRSQFRDKTWQGGSGMPVDFLTKED